MARRDLRRAAVPAFVGGVALTTALGVGVATINPPPAPTATAVDLSALINHGSATNWGAEGIDKFYGVDWYAKYVPEGGDRVVSQFSLFPYNVNPDNLTRALRENVGDVEPDLVLTSGRGSGAATVTMLILLNGSEADRQMVYDTRWILDNNVNRPNGGYGSRYIPFSILGVYPWPTPIEDENIDILDVGYEYAWNSSAPAYVTNLVALLNSIIAYAYRYKSQAFTGLPLDPETGAKDPVTGEPKLEKGYHYIVDVEGNVTKVPLETQGTNTTFVTYRAAGLPMLQPLRDWGGKFGNAVADLLQPALKVIVDASYPDNDPVANPDRYITASLFTPPKEAITALKQLPGAIREGVDNFKKHFSNDSQAPEATLQRTVAADDAERALPGKERWRKVLGVRDRRAAAAAELSGGTETAGTGKALTERPKRAGRLVERLSKALGPKHSQDSGPKSEGSGPDGGGPED